MKLASLALCATLVLAACASSSNVSGERRNIGGVTMTFTVVPSRVKRGQAVRLTIRLVNNAGTPAKLTFPSSQKYDFWITSGGREIWRWSSGRMFAQEVARQEIGGQTGIVFSESWSPEQAGTLAAHAEFLAQTYRGGMKGSLIVG